MNTGQTMLTVGALVILSLLTMSFYGSMGRANRNISQSEAGITANTLATSFIELAQNTAFDSYTDTMQADDFIANADLLTHWDKLGREDSLVEDSMRKFNDFDDFNGWTEYRTPGGMLGKFRADFRVYYVDTLDVDKEVKYCTFVKRMDIKVWRVEPPLDTMETKSVYDTARASCFMGYYKFN